MISNLVCLPLLLGVLAHGPSHVSMRSWEPDSTWRVPTVDRAQFLPSLHPPFGPTAVSQKRMPDGSVIIYGGGASMNRVDGFGPLLLQEVRNRPWMPSIRSYESYGTVSHHWSGGVEAWIYPGTRVIEIGGRWFDETAPWFLPVQPVTAEENFAAALLLREDFSNYLRRRGKQAFITWTPATGRSLQITWSNEEQRSQDRARGRLGLFGGHKEYRQNPAIEEGRWRLMRARGIWSLGTADGSWQSRRAHAFLIETMASGGFLGTNREFVRVWAEQRGRQWLTPSQFVGYRLTYGWTPRGETLPGADASRLPAQWQFQAGGIGTLRGERFGQFHGDRIALATLEYGFDLGHDVRPVIFVDEGKAWNQADHQSGGIKGSGPLATDGGVGLQLGGGAMTTRIDVARDLRAARAPARVSLRLGIPF